MNDSRHDEDKSSGDGALHLVRELVRRRIFIAVSGLLCGVAAAVVAFMMPNIYTATVSAVPPRKSSSSLDAAMSSVSSTLREFGLTKLAGKKSEGYDFIVLLQSRQIQDTLIRTFNLASVYELPDTAMTRIREALLDRININLEVEGNFTVSVDDEDPGRAAAMANAVIEEVNKLSARIDKSESEVLAQQFELKIQATDRQIHELRDSIAQYAKKKMIFSPTDQAKAAAAVLGEIKAEKMKQQIALNVLEQSYGKDDPLTVQQRSVVHQLILREAEAESLPGFLGNASLGEAAGTALPYLRYTAELEALIKLKAFLIPSYEQVKLDVNKVVPSLYVVDEAQPPQKKSRPKRMLIALSATFGGVLLSIVLIIALFQISVLRQKLASNAHESELSS